MSTDNLALLFRLRGDASGLRTAAAQGQQAVNQLKQAFGPELAQTVSLTNKAFGDVGLGIGNLTQRIPVVGNAVSRLTDLLRNAGVESKTSEKALSSVANTIGNIAKESGKSIPQVAQFLTRFTQLKTSTDKNTEAFNFFGGSVDLIGNKTARFIPQLNQASTALGTVSAESAAAGAGMAGLAHPIGVAIIAVGAMIAGLALVSRELFNITRTAADFQGKMQDLSQQTGVAVETLSTLEVAITQTGGNLNTVTQALVQFQRQLEESQDPLSKAAKNFERLGVTVTDTENTLRNALRALARMPEGFAQTNAAAELFGSRGGKQVLALLKETNGDIDALQEKLRETGTLITTDAARAADEFNDELALLDFQIRSVSAVIARDLLPPMTEVVKATAELVRAAKPLLGIVGTLAGPTVSGIAKALQGLGLVTQALTQDFKGLARSIAEMEAEAAKLKDIPALTIPSLTAPLPSGQSAREAANEQIQLEEEVLAAAQRRARVVNQQLEESFQRGRIDAAKRAEETIANNRTVLERDKQLFTAQREAEELHFKEIQNRRDLAESERREKLQESANKITAIRQKELDAEALFDTTSREIRLRAAQQAANSRRAQVENETNIVIKEFERQTAGIEAAIASGAQAEEVGLTTIEALERAKIDARREGLERQKAIGLLTIDEQRALDRQINELNQEADRLQDDQQARRERRQREHSERIRQLKLAEIQSLLEAERIAGESIIASIEAQAALRIRTEESASREILRIRLKLIDDEVEALRAQQESAKSIPNLTERTQVQAELNNQIRILLAQRAAIEAQGARDIDDARQTDLDNEREYADELRDIQDQIVDIQRQAAEEVIRLMIVSGARRRDIIRAERDLELARENDRHQRVTESIRAQQRETDEQIRVLEQRLERLKIGTTEEIAEHDRLTAALERLRAKRAELKAQQDAEDERTKTRKRRVTVETDLDLANPDIGLDDVFDDIGKAVTDLAGKFAELIGLGKEFSLVSAQIAQQLGGVLAGAFNQFANALGQTVANWVLLGETGPAVMRKILAQALASIAAEAAVQAIKELALGFATLFFNPAESAGHFTAAALWGSIAGGAALAGRATAGDLFKQKSNAASAPPSSSSAEALNTIIQGRNQPQRVEVILRSDLGELDRVISASVVRDIGGGGPIREVINTDGR